MTVQVDAQYPNLWLLMGEVVETQKLVGLDSKPLTNYLAPRLGHTTPSIDNTIYQLPTGRELVDFDYAWRLMVHNFTITIIIIYFMDAQNQLYHSFTTLIQDGPHSYK